MPYLGQNLTLMPTRPYKAFVFDMNGTMIDDMEFHTQAWHQILTQDLKAALSVEEVRPQMYGKNSEVLARIFGENHFTPQEADELSNEKERRYQRAYKPHLRLINGLNAFLEKAAAHDIKMAIASAAIKFNIDFVVDNLKIRSYFGALVSADDVTKSKPHPETFLKAAEQLSVAPEDCLVFEDVPKGVEAAQNAGMDCLVITTMHTKEEFSHLTNIIGFVEDYHDPLLEQLLLKS